MQPHDNLDPIDPESAVELYLSDREDELSRATVYSHRSRLGHFVRWCDEQDLTNLNDLTGRLLQEYRVWQREEGGLNPVSVKTQMDTLRVFIRWCEDIDAVERDLSQKVRIPTLAAGENARDVMLDSETAAKVLVPAQHNPLARRSASRPGRENTATAISEYQVSETVTIVQVGDSRFFGLN